MYFWVAVMYSDTSIKWNRHAVPCANLFTLNSHFTAPSRPVFHNISSAGHKTTATHSPQGHEHTAALSHCVLQSLCANTMDPITLFHCVSCKMPFSNFFFLTLSWHSEKALCALTVKGDVALPAMHYSTSLFPSFFIGLSFIVFLQFLLRLRVL